MICEKNRVREEARIRAREKKGGRKDGRDLVKKEEEKEVPSMEDGGVLCA